MASVSRSHPISTKPMVRFLGQMENTNNRIKHCRRMKYISRKPKAETQPENKLRNRWSATKSLIHYMFLIYEKRLAHTYHKWLSKITNIASENPVITRKTSICIIHKYNI